MTDFEKWETDAVDLESYFRATETQESEALFCKVTEAFLNNEVLPTFDLGEDEGE